MRVLRRAARVGLVIVPLGACTAQPSGRPAGTVDTPIGTIEPGQAPVLQGYDVYPNVPSPDLPPRPGHLAVPAVVSGTLDAHDLHPSDAQQNVADDYLLELTAGVPVTLVARGGASSTYAGSSLDMFVYLYFNRNEVARDDDGASAGGALNSRIVYTPTQTGTYLFRVSTYGSSLSTGPYTVQTYRGALTTQL